MQPMLRDIVVADHRHAAAARAMLAEQRRWLEEVIGGDLMTVQPEARAEYADPVRYYRWPYGRLLLARSGGRMVGCVGIRRVDARTAELKRMYMRPAARGIRAGVGLLRAAIETSEALGVERIVLDTKLPEMAIAVALYRSMGFVEVEEESAWSATPGALRLERPVSAPLERSA